MAGAPDDRDDKLPELPAESSDDPAAAKTDLPAIASASESGSVEVAMSKPDMPASASGSVDVAMSKPDMPASDSGAVNVGMSQTGIPQAVPAADSRPVASGGVAAVAAAHDTGPVGGRSKRITKAMQDAASGAVERLGASIGTIGEGVAKVGDVTKKVPLVGASVGKLGEGLTKAGESIHALPRVAQTRRGRLLVRSVVVGFLIVFSWIALIVAIQLRSAHTPDFRPAAEKILLEISEGKAGIEDVYEKSSPRFQEFVLKERFVDLMKDLNATNGKFQEITAVNETVVGTGPTGPVARVGLTALFENGIARGSISFHKDKDGKWKFLGIGIEVPSSVHITQAEREKRVAACIDEKGKDISDQRAACPVRDAAETILEQIRDGRAGEVYDNASDIFKQQETRANFIRIHEDMKIPLGAYKRLLTVTEAKSIGGLTAFFDTVAEFEKSSGVRIIFNFSREKMSAKWQLRSLKIVVPMPRPDEERSLVPPAPDVKVDEAPLMREIGSPPAPATRTDAGSAR